MAIQVICDTLWGRLTKNIIRGNMGEDVAGRDRAKFSILNKTYFLCFEKSHFDRNYIKLDFMLKFGLGLIF